MNGNRKLLAIFPHPDDETLGVGSTLARYAAEGVDVHLVCATRGERGWSEGSGPNPGMQGIARIREAELRCASEHLGLHEVHFLDYIDGDLESRSPGNHCKDHRPTPPHPAAGGLICAADASYEDGQPAHQVSKFYYSVDSAQVVETLNNAFGGISMEIDGVSRKHVGWHDWQITTWLDNHRYMDKVRDATHCHTSQLPGFGTLPEWSVDELSKVFGTGTFYRVYSLVNGGRGVERDLFEGLQ